MTGPGKSSDNASTSRSATMLGCSARRITATSLLRSSKGSRLQLPQLPKEWFINSHTFCHAPACNTDTKSVPAAFP